MAMVFAPWRAWAGLRDVRPPAARAFRELWKTELARGQEQER